MKQSKVTFALMFAGLAAAVLVPACGSSGDASSVAPNDDANADQVEIVRGVSDKGRNPAVIAIDVGETALCTGTLIAPDVVLTARHCVSKTAEQVDCGSGSPQVTGERAASSLKILVGDDVASAKPEAIGKEVITPEGSSICGADIALIVLDRPIEGIEPLDVRVAGVAKGDHVSAVGFGRRADGEAAGTRLLREHVRVLEASVSEFLVGEATCQGDSGGPALDEASGEIVGVVSRGGPECDGKDAHNVYTRTDAFLSLVDDALAKSSLAPPDDAADVPCAAGSGASHPKHRDAGSSHRPPRGHAPKKPKTKKPKSDMGGTCKVASDCAAGVCVTEHGKQYCSRACDTHDRCPAHFRCSSIKSGKQVCTEH